MFTIHYQSGSVVGYATTIESARTFCQSLETKRLTIRKDGKIVETVNKGGIKK